MPQSAPTAAPPPTVDAGPLTDRPWIRPAVIFILLMTVYLADGGFLPAGDATPNLYVPVSLLTGRGLSFTPQVAPFMFLWKMEAYGRTQEAISVYSWDTPLAGRRAGDWYADGNLRVSKPRYYLVPSIREGRYVDIYGPGAGLVSVPYFAALAALSAGWREDSRVLGFEAKVLASALVAGSAVLVYLTLLGMASRTASLALSLLYGLGTCVWTEPTRALWQQTPTLFFVALGCRLLWRSPGAPGGLVWSGLALGLSTLCRPTMGILLALIGGSLVLKNRRSCLEFIAGALVPVGFLLSYTAIQMGSPFRFGQVAAAQTLAASSGSGDGVLAPSFWQSAAGLLVSPSRGLLVFSPFLVFAIGGAIEAWRRPEYGILRPLGMAVVIGIVVAASWRLWEGGVCFGYRIIVEWTPVLVLLIGPVADRLLRRKDLGIVFAGLAAWSLVVQALGAFAYDPISWNLRPGFEIRFSGESATHILTNQEEADRLIASGKAQPVRKVAMDVGQSQFRWRLWSVRDSQIGLLLTELPFKASRDVRQGLMRTAARDKFGAPGP